MTTESTFWDHWYYYLPDYVLAVLIYTLIARFLLQFVIRPDSTIYIWRFFRQITDWYVRAVALVTPRAVPTLLLIPIAAFWAFVLRSAWTLVFLAATGSRIATAG